ncbi:MAG: cyanophycinase [Actinomycetota bacterium]|jgi:cyanophycinase
MIIEQTTFRINRRLVISLILVLTMSAVSLFSQDNNQKNGAAGPASGSPVAAGLAPESPVAAGPAAGSLVIAGGGRLSDTIIERFIDLAGGAESRIVYVPTADGVGSYNDTAVEFLRSRGAMNVVILHTGSRDTANSEVFTRPLEEATGVWFGGGRQWRLVDSYIGTRTEEMFRRVLERGGVIGGSSAGATIQGSFLVRGDTKNNQIMMGDHQKGFGYISNTAIDQHVLARNRQFDMYEVIRAHPGLLGISIDENTAAIVQGDTLDVLGASYILIYDGTFWSREGSELKTLPGKESLFYMIRQGDRYDLRQRRVID